jgi:hypothetical protein
MSFIWLQGVDEQLRADADEGLPAIVYSGNKEQLHADAAEGRAALVSTPHCPSCGTWDLCNGRFCTECRACIRSPTCPLPPGHPGHLHLPGAADLWTEADYATATHRNCIAFAVFATNPSLEAVDESDDDSDGYLDYLDGSTDEGEEQVDDHEDSDHDDSSDGYDAPNFEFDVPRVDDATYIDAADGSVVYKRLEH